MTLRSQALRVGEGGRCRARADVVGHDIACAQGGWSVDSRECAGKGVRGQVYGGESGVRSEHLRKGACMKCVSSDSGVAVVH